MSRYIWDKAREQFVPAAEYVRPMVARSHLPAPRIMTDGIEVQSVLDGKTYTSKAALRATYRAAGVEEVGNEPMRAPERKIEAPPGLKDEIRAAWSAHS